MLSVDWDTTGAFDEGLVHSLEELATRYAAAIETFDIDHFFRRLELELKELEEQGRELDFQEILVAVAEMVGCHCGAVLPAPC